MKPHTLLDNILFPSAWAMSGLLSFYYRVLGVDGGYLQQPNFSPWQLTVPRLSRTKEPTIMIKISFLELWSFQCIRNRGHHLDNFFWAAAAAEKKAYYSARDGVVAEAVHQMVGRHGLLSSARGDEEKEMTRIYALFILHSTSSQRIIGLV